MPQLLIIVLPDQKETEDTDGGAVGSRVEEINSEEKGLREGNERINNLEKKHYRPHSEAVHAEVALLGFLFISGFGKYAGANNHL